MDEDVVASPISDTNTTAPTVLNDCTPPGQRSSEEQQSPPQACGYHQEHQSQPKERAGRAHQYSRGAICEWLGGRHMPLGNGWDALDRHAAVLPLSWRKTAN